MNTDYISWSDKWIRGLVETFCYCKTTFWKIFSCISTRQREGAKSFSNKTNLVITAKQEKFSRAVALYLRLDPVEAAAPQRLTPPQLHLSMVDLVFVLQLLQLILRDLLLLGAMTGCFQETQPAGGHAGHQLGEEQDYKPVRDTKTNTTLRSAGETRWPALLRWFIWQVKMVSCISVDSQNSTR